MYHPNPEQLIRTARALFAGDARPLDERIVLEQRTLSDATGGGWRIQVPSAADPRIAALLEAHREAEMYQAAPFPRLFAQLVLSATRLHTAIPASQLLRVILYRWQAAASTGRYYVSTPSSAQFVQRARSHLMTT